MKLRIRQKFPQRTLPAIDVLGNRDDVFADFRQVVAENFEVADNFIGSLNDPRNTSDLRTHKNAVVADKFGGFRSTGDLHRLVAEQAVALDANDRILADVVVV